VRLLEFYVRPSDEPEPLKNLSKHIAQSIIVADFYFFSLGASPSVPSPLPFAHAPLSMLFPYRETTIEIIYVSCLYSSAAIADRDGSRPKMFRFRL